MDLLQPKFYFSHQLIRVFCLILIFLPFPIFVTMIFFEILKPFMASPITAFFGAAIICLLIDFCGAFFATLVIKAFYHNSQFKILKDRVEYSSDFMGLRIKDLKFKNIKEMSLVQNILQKKFGLGTIYLLTHASPQSSKSTGSGLKIYNIQESQKVYNLLKKEVDKAESSTSLIS